MAAVIVKAESDTTEKVIGLLKQNFSGSQWIPFNVSERIAGFLIWDGFTDYSHRSRQRMLWQSFEDALSEDEMEQISGIMTFTPEEYDDAIAVE